MRRVIDNDYLTLAFRIILGVVFIYASIYKILDPGGFAKSIWYYHMVPGDLINLMAITMPWIELLAGAALIFGVSYRGGLLLITVMTAVFLIALISAVARNLSIDCGCFKASEKGGSSAFRALIQDSVMVLAIIQLWFSRSRRWIRGRSSKAVPLA
jgi:putative oxidoreductase